MKYAKIISPRIFYYKLHVQRYFPTHNSMRNRQNAQTKMANRKRHSRSEKPAIFHIGGPISLLVKSSMTPRHRPIDFVSQGDPKLSRQKAAEEIRIKNHSRFFELETELLRVHALRAHHRGIRPFRKAFVRISYKSVRFVVAISIIRSRNWCRCSCSRYVFQR